MKTTRRTVEIVTLSSSLHPEVTTEIESHGQIIEWADARPEAWRLVMGHSPAWGKNATHYPGFDRGDSPHAIVGRLLALRHALARSPDELFSWSASFSLQHVGDKGFKGGFFQQHDGTYPRGCTYLDYTPATLEKVIDRFLVWCAATCSFPTKTVTLDKKTVRAFAEGA